MTVQFNYLKPLVDLVEKSAPTLASALLGPVGGMAVSLIESLFGIKPSDDPVAKITSDPDHDLKLKKLENDHIESLKNIDLQLAKADVEDTESARNRELELAKSNHPNNIMSYIAYLTITAFFAYLICVVLKLIQFDAAIFTQLVSMSTGISGYYFAKSHKD